MFQVILQKIKRDQDYPARAYMLSIFKMILDGTLYCEAFDRQYHDEWGGNDANQYYIAEQHRAPSVTSGLALMRAVVEESVSFLFGNDRFPEFMVDDEDTKDFIEKTVTDTRLVEIMQDAATRGSIGSVAIFLKVSKQRFFLEVFDTIFLTPTYDPDEPDQLIKIVKKHKLLGVDLVELGYSIAKENLQTKYWYHRYWDTNEEVMYVPYKVTDTTKPDFRLVRDEERSVTHKLGFVPFVWMVNMVGSGNKYDGKCTFLGGIQNCIEIDYVLSRASRALKYNADPLTVIKVRNPETLAEFAKDAGNALVIGVEGDAKLLETSGNAAASSFDMVKQLRDSAMEAMHGSRHDPDKLATSNSSIALRLLHAPMLQLAGHLRLQYGEYGIIPLLKMMMQIAAKRQGTSIPMKLMGKIAPKVDIDQDIVLNWPDYFAPAPYDVLQIAQAIPFWTDAGIFSKETIRENMRPFIDFGGSDEEAAKAEQDMDATQQREIDTQTAVEKAKAVNKPRPATK